MPSYKSPDNKVHCIDSEIFAHLLPAGSVEISDEEAALLQAPKVDQIKAHACDAIKAIRDQRKAGGVKVKVGAGDKWFHSDDSSRVQILALVALGDSIPADRQWKTMDGSSIAMNKAVAEAVLKAIVDSDQAVFDVAEGRLVAMEASADPAAYDYSIGWPKVFGE